MQAYHSSIKAMVVMVGLLPATVMAGAAYITR